MEPNPTTVTDDPAGRYGIWKAPAEDGGLIIWPAPARLLQQTVDNSRRLRAASAVQIQNVPLPDLRDRLRQSFNVSSPDTPLIINGHQAELHHPGVWVKNILIDLLAEKLDGRAVHVAIDTDAPKHLALRWPGGSQPLSDDRSTARVQWSGLLAAPTLDHLNHIESVFQQAASSWDFQTMVPGFLDSMRRLSAPGASLPAVLTAAQHAIDAGLGLKHDAMIATPLWESPAYLMFAYHVAARADAFANDYNAALAEYRERNRIRSAGRPMPDLQVSAERCEIPFWLDDLGGGARTRGMVLRRGDRWAIASAGGEQFSFDPAMDGWRAAEMFGAWLADRKLRVAPRALTLTAVLRLLAADQFVHGIGGAQYDQVTDVLIARHLQLDPPRFSVTTATQFFPQSVGWERVCVPCVVQEGHRLKHDILGREKRDLADAIAAAPRGSDERATLFHKMHHQLSTAWTLPAVRQWEQRLRDTVEREVRERALFDRELFYAIQPKDRALSMIESYRDAMDSTDWTAASSHR